MSSEYSRSREVETAAIAELVHVHKSFGDNHVLKDVNLRLFPGEIVGLLGANGAGKSTLVKLINGVESPSAGEISLGGQAIQSEKFTVVDAASAGIYCVYQELSLCTNLTAQENFMLENNFPPGLSERERNQRTMAAIAEVFPTATISVNTDVSELPLAQRQIVEIVRAATHPGLKLLILDEPTSALLREYVEHLHEFLRALVNSGVCVLYVSHKLEEIRNVTNRIVILKNGEIHYEGTTQDISLDMLLELLSGTRELASSRPNTALDRIKTSRTLLHLQNFNSRGLHDVTLVVHPGEVVGIAGLEGAGQRELLRAINSMQESKVPQRVGTHVYVPGDRQTEGIFPLWDIYNNVLISSVRRISSWGIIKSKAAEELVNSWMKRLQFTAVGPQQSITEVSGGTQQKALIARGLASGSELLLLDDPTRGVDIETKQEIYGILQEVRAEGRSALFYSTEDSEFVHCDRVYVMARGTVVAELAGSDITVPNIIRASYLGVDDAKTEIDRQSMVKRANRLRIFNARAFLAIALLVVILGINAVAEPASIGVTGLDLLLGVAVPLAFAAVGQMFIIMAGDIDLGIGSALGLVNVVVAVYLVGHVWLGWLALVGLVLAYGAMGFLIHRRRLPAIVVTLGASFVWLGIALIIQPTPGGSVPNWLGTMYNANLPIIPEPVYILVALAALVWVLLFRTRYGRVIRGFGNNAAAVFHAGHSPMKARVVLYMAAAVCVVLAGLAITATSGSADANASSTYTLSSIAAVIVGGGEFLGAIVSPLGAVAAAIAISLISSLLAFLNVNSYYEAAATGLVLLGALAIRRMGRSRN